MSRLPIHEAAINGDVDALRKELETSAPDVECPNGIVPLHYLVAYASYATNRHDTVRHELEPERRGSTPQVKR